MSLRWTHLAGLAAVALTAGGGMAAYSTVRPYHPGTPAEISAMTFAPYEEQKVVYHITYSGGLRDRAYRNLLHVANNHLAAVGDGWLDLRILLQGDGLDLLIAAKSNGDFARRIDALKARGVRFVVCWNTITSKGIDPQAELYGVTKADIVGSSMAEAAALQQKGYVLLRPQ